jgi:glycosyltransferase involved in cell wall biosynthesis
MRIAFFSAMAGSPWGGSEELWCRAANSLLKRGHEVAFNCIAWPSVPAPLQQLIENGAQAKFRSRQRMGRSLRQALQKLKLTKYRYFNWLKQTKPDLVVISFACHTDDPQIANTCQAMGVPYAILLQAAGTHSWIDSRNIDDFRSAYAHAKRCFFVSPDNREIVESNLAMELPRADIVDNPFSVQADAKPSWPATAPHWKLACVGRIHYASKGQDLIVRVLRQPKWRTRPLQVTLWGGDNGSLSVLRRALDIYGLHRQISYGGVSSNIEQLWTEHHGLLLPSRMEGNALALVEAMICGRMPITTDVGRAGELIDDNDSGFIAPAATEALLDDALERAWQRRDDWRAIGQRAAHAIRTRHSLQPAEDFADGILSIFAAAETKKAAAKLAA